MKPSSIVHTTALLWGFSMTTAALMPPAAAAAAFDQKELDQSSVIAVAVPLAQGDRYNLLILEQLSNAKQCWQPDASNPNLIDPLLLKFDFTNICGRSTDSNGFSVRIAGQDRAMDYRLSVVKENDHLVLLAIPSRNAQEPILAIARTESLVPGFLKLQLNPEWRFTKRTYSGKTLGHIYLTRDTTGGAGYIAANQGGFSGRSVPRTAQPLASPPSRSLFPPTQRRQPSYSRSLTPITGAIQIPVPAPSTTGRLRPPYAAAAPRSSSRVFQVSAPPEGGLPTVAAGVLPVPASNIPMGNVGSEPDLITASTPSLNLSTMAPGASGGGIGTVTPPFQVAMANFRYRVFVNAVNGSQQKAVKTLVPDSFRSSYQGRSMIQVGAFQDRVKADEVIDLLNRNGITSILATE
jgi:Protein of unknown function (DUF3747)